MSNRVEDLERQVAELQAAVNGLTEELVEMKERVRQLEDDRSVSVETDTPPTSNAAEDTDDTSDTSSDATGGERRTHSDDHVDVVEQTEPSAADGGRGETTAAAGDEVIVPEQEPTTPDAESNQPTETRDDENGESDDSDIIVA
ncbi:MAG: bZIP transcription factor [Halorubrum sp.]